MWNRRGSIAIELNEFARQPARNAAAQHQSDGNDRYFCDVGLDIIKSPRQAIDRGIETVVRVWVHGAVDPPKLRLERSNATPTEKSL